MTKSLYSIHFLFRKYFNYFLYKIYYRLKYPEMVQYYATFRAQSFSGSSVKFLKVELDKMILSSSEILNSNSIVFDVGGETGIWAMQVYSKYAPCLYIFEPHPRFVEVLKQKFHDKRARIFGYGLGSKNLTTSLSDSGMGSSVYESSPGYDGSGKFRIEIRDIVDVISELKLNSVDLIKINIEGGEYDLLPGMIESGIVNKCKIIRIQFHDWIPDAFAMRKKIVKELSKTHDIEWSYPMVWESWIRKDIAAKNVTVK
jgi:FkbM family methyltransferase